MAHFFALPLPFTISLRNSWAGQPSSPAHVLIVPKGDLRQEQQPPLTASIPLDSLSQALITVFKESFPRAREELKKRNAQFDPQLLDATYIQLDKAYLSDADLQQIWMRHASLRKANLIRANLREANLRWANLSGADLSKAKLSGANLKEARLWKAKLSRADLSGVNLRGANLYGANLLDAKLAEADLQGAKYNTKAIQERDARGRLVTTKPTQWPQGFDPSRKPAMIADPTPSAFSPNLFGKRKSLGTPQTLPGRLRPLDPYFLTGLLTLH